MFNTSSGLFTAGYAIPRLGRFETGPVAFERSALVVLVGAVSDELDAVEETSSKFDAADDDSPAPLGNGSMVAVVVMIIVTVLLLPLVLLLLLKFAPT